MMILSAFELGIQVGKRIGDFFTEGNARAIVFGVRETVGGSEFYIVTTKSVGWSSLART